MPRRDGTGPMRRGSMSGIGLGVCTGANVARCGAGVGQGRGFDSRSYFESNLTAKPTTSKTQKELLTEQKEELETRLNLISKQLESL